ncbi:MAG: hypothetical protein JXB03_06370 [Spirochaetales bacterium]|nr:hypothetical protein [Spirochaetales bacterium]
MKIETIASPSVRVSQNQKELPLIEGRDIKAILYLGIRGTVMLPEEKHKVDISA